MLKRKNHVRNMLHTIEQECAFTGRLTGRPSLRREVMEAMAKVPREEFVTEQMRPYAYANNALPIDYGQTISQPFIVALMTDLLDPKKEHRVLEIGTGSGYQAAVLSLLVKEVVSLEIIPELARAAEARLERLGYHNVQVHHGDGYHGFPPKAPYDSIIITAAVSHVPPLLLEQLKPRGRLVLPIGLPYMHQELMLVEKNSAGGWHTQSVLGVAFVPMTGDAMKGTEKAEY